MNKKLLATMAMTGTATAYAAEEVVQQPDIWMPHTPKAVDSDIPWFIAEYTNDANLDILYRPESVDLGKIEFLNQAATIGNWIFLSIVVMIVLFSIFLAVNGRVKLAGGFSGKKVDRWSLFDVVLHWVVALPCLLLIATGVAIGSGGEWFQSLMGADRFAGFIDGSVGVHGFFGVIFSVGAVVMMVKWMGRQIPASYDLAWFAKLGGYINCGKSCSHPDAGFANAGEKAFFWTFVIAGLVLIGSGLMLLWPEQFDVVQNTANFALIAHIVAAIVLGAFTVVHIFMGAFISEGGMECMVSGQCDENWAKQHHNLWFAKVNR